MSHARTEAWSVVSSEAHTAFGAAFVRRHHANQCPDYTAKNNNLKERVKGVVDSVGSVCYVAKDIMVDIITEASNDTIGVGRNFILDGSEQNPLAETGEESGDSKGQNKQGRYRSSISEEPSNKNLSLALEARSNLDAKSRRHRSRCNIDDVHWVIRVLSNEARMLLLPSPAPDLKPSHGNDGCQGEDDQNSNEDGSSFGDEVK
ncbi:hypothetical protein HG530_012209 [Fusarium avenaceum]|nr:hypothetical protein HG530_012209 [Fusarium avenaceum]